MRSTTRLKLRKAEGLAPVGSYPAISGQAAQTLMQRAEVRPDISERGLAQGWVETICDRYHPERADALEKLDALVDQISKTIDWWKGRKRPQWLDTWLRTPRNRQGTAFGLPLLFQGSGFWSRVRGHIVHGAEVWRLPPMVESRLRWRAIPTILIWVPATSTGLPLALMN